VIKPAWRDKPWSALVGGRDKLIVADSRSVLMRSASVVDPLLGNCLIQEVVPGPEGNILCSFVYLDERSEPLALCQCRKLRQYPLDFGTTSMAEVTWDSEVDSLTRSICSRLKLTGYISIEFKRDADDGRLKILEITPGRLNRQGAITALAGTNIVYVWYRHLVGDPIKRLGQPTTPTKWISEVNELRSVPRYLQQGRLSPRQILASYRRLRGLEIVSVRDPVPTLLCASMVIRATGASLCKRALFSWIPKSV
jgi:predicted ATP-grasp superfamily ATP-dependent carboligase